MPMPALWAQRLRGEHASGLPHGSCQAPSPVRTLHRSASRDRRQASSKSRPCFLHHMVRNMGHLILAGVPSRWRLAGLGLAVVTAALPDAAPAGGLRFSAPLSRRVDLPPRDDRDGIKFCGMTRVEDVDYAARLGVDAIGLIFAARSPRRIDLHTARLLRGAMPPFVTSVALTVDAELMQLREIVQALRPGLLQFHGEEAPEDCVAAGVPFLKAVPMVECGFAGTGRVTLRIGLSSTPCRRGDGGGPSRGQRLRPIRAPAGAPATGRRQRVDPCARFVFTRRRVERKRGRCPGEGQGAHARFGAKAGDLRIHVIDAIDAVPPRSRT